MIKLDFFAVWVGTRRGGADVWFGLPQGQLRSPFWLDSYDFEPSDAGLLKVPSSASSDDGCILTTLYLPQS